MRFCLHCEAPQTPGPSVPYIEVSLHEERFEIKRSGLESYMQHIGLTSSRKRNLFLLNGQPRPSPMRYDSEKEKQWNN